MDFFGRDKLGWVFDRLYFQLYGVFIGWFAFAENMFDGQKRGAKTTIVFWFIWHPNTFASSLPLACGNCPSRGLRCLA